MLVKNINLVYKFHPIYKLIVHNTNCALEEVVISTWLLTAKFLKWSEAPRESMMIYVPVGT